MSRQTFRDQLGKTLNDAHKIMRDLVHENPAFNEAISQYKMILKNNINHLEKQRKENIITNDSDLHELINRELIRFNNNLHVVARSTHTKINDQITGMDPSSITALIQAEQNPNSLASQQINDAIATEIAAEIEMMALLQQNYTEAPTPEPNAHEVEKNESDKHANEKGSGIVGALKKIDDVGGSKKEEAKKEVEESVEKAFHEITGTDASAFKKDEHDLKNLAAFAPTPKPPVNLIDEDKK